MTNLGRRVDRLERQAPDEWDEGPLEAVWGRIYEHAFEDGEAPDLSGLLPRTDRTFWGPEDDTPAGRRAGLYADYIDLYLELAADEEGLDRELGELLDASEGKSA